MERRILVLDMDGVVNSDDLIYGWVKSRMRELGALRPSASERELAEMARNDFFRIMPRDELVFPELASLVSSVVSRTGCSIMWSSDWRMLPLYWNNLDSARAMFDRRGLPGSALIGSIPPLGRLFLRGDEIRSWLADAGYDPSADRVAVVDDLDEAGMGLPEGVLFLRTDARRGITAEIADRACEFMNS